MFTLTDKTLLDRAARMINVQARGLRVLHEAQGWASTEAGRKAKQEYDRLLHFDVKADRSKPIPQDTAEVGDPLNALSPEARADYLSDLGPGSNRDFSGLKFDVPRETSAGKPELQSTAPAGMVTGPLTGGGEDVGF